jgi:hypothetical protein
MNWKAVKIVLFMCSYMLFNVTQNPSPPNMGFSTMDLDIFKTPQIHPPPANLQSSTLLEVRLRLESIDDFLPRVMGQRHSLMVLKACWSGLLLCLKK